LPSEEIEGSSNGGQQNQAHQIRCRGGSLDVALSRGPPPPQADGKKIRRVAPLDFIGHYTPHWFDYAYFVMMFPVEALSTPTQ
jgi:hypothetical protein